MTPFALLEDGLRKEAARGDQLIKSLKAIATSAAKSTPENSAHAATKLDRILNYGLQRSQGPGNTTAKRDVMDFVNKVREKGKGVMHTSSVNDAVGGRGAISLTGRKSGYPASHVKEVISDSDPAYLNDPLAKDYSQTVLDTLKSVIGGK